MAVEGAPVGWLQDWAAIGTGKNARVGVLLVHGFTGSPASMRPWGEFLHSKGYTVRVPLLPGHGTQPEPLNKVKWQEWPAKVEFELSELRKSCDHIFLVGLSMGGGTVLNVAASHNETSDQSIRPELNWSIATMLQRWITTKRLSFKTR